MKKQLGQISRIIKKENHFSSFFQKDVAFALPREESDANEQKEDSKKEKERRKSFDQAELGHRRKRSSDMDKQRVCFAMCAACAN